MAWTRNEQARGDGLLTSKKVKPLVEKPWYNIWKKYNLNLYDCSFSTTSILVGQTAICSVVGQAASVISIAICRIAERYQCCGD